MGINSLFKLIERHAPDSFTQIPISKFVGKRIAIDGNNWMYTNLAIARKKIINKIDISNTELSQTEIRKEWFNMALTFIIGWLSHEITPVFVFDGIHPAEKKDTKDKRRDERLERKRRIDILYEKMKEDSLNVAIQEELRKELRNYVCIKNEDFELFVEVIRGIGIPVLKAQGDGEQLCSMLCREGKVAAVFSADTDNLVYGCPLLITKFSDAHQYVDGSRITMVDCVIVERVLAGLKISFETFVDLCIMCGCDYNSNMPGYASIKSYALMTKFGSIDNIPKTFDVSILKHERCRELFSVRSSAELTNDELNLNINKEALLNMRDYLDQVGVSNRINQLVICYNAYKEPTDGHIPIPDAELRDASVRSITRSGKEGEETTVKKKFIINFSSSSK